MNTTTDELPEGVTAVETPPPPPDAVPVYNVPAPGTDHEQRIENIIVYGHSNLFYWWPVWLVSFILAGWTYADGYRMAVIPPDAQLIREAEIAGVNEPRDALVAPQGKPFAFAAAENADATSRPDMAVARSNALGVIFVFTLFVVTWLAHSPCEGWFRWWLSSA